MISQAVNGVALNLLRGDVFIAVYVELAVRRLERVLNPGNETTRRPIFAKTAKTLIPLGFAPFFLRPISPFRG
jgi:hypothetical protein